MPVQVRGRRRRPLVLSLLIVALIGLAAMALPSTAAATGPVIVGSQLSPGGKLMPGQSLQSRSGGYRLDMQPDGNLVLEYPCTPGDPGCPDPAWVLGTAGRPGNYLVMQGDGNLVLYSQSGRPVWATQTRGANSKFVLQSDANLVVYSGTQAVWSSGPVGSYAHVAGRQVGDLVSANGRYRFGTPGNSMHTWDFGAPGGARIMWGVNCLNDPRVDCTVITGRLILQNDGNLVWYQPGITGGWVAEWSTNTWGMGPTNYLVMQNDGNLVLYDLWHRPLWNSKGGPVRRVH